MPNAVYRIFIKNYLNGSGNYVTTEQELYSIPIANDTNALNDPTVKTELGKTGSFEFGMHPDHPYFNSWRQMKTIMRVEYDGTTLFRGRVLTIDISPLTGEKKLHLEGDMAFLMDSQQEGVKEEERTEITILAYLQKIINAHNTQMNEGGDTDKRITLGEVPGQYTSATNTAQRIVITEATKKFGSDSWETSMNALEALGKEYGGYFRTRYENGTCYLDWLDYCLRYEINGQPIQIGENLIEISGSTEVDNIFTAVIPVGSAKGKDLFIDGYREDIHGANKRILVPQIVSLFTDAQLNKGYHAKADYQNAVNNYGIIYKTQSFQNADTKEKLWEYATDWIRENYAGGITSFDLTALDMHHLNGVVQKYLTGDRITVIYPDLSAHADGVMPTITKILTILSSQYYLHNPEKNTYRAGIPNNLLNRVYGHAKKGGGGGGGGGSLTEQPDPDVEAAGFSEDIRGLERLAWDAVINAKYNNEEYQRLLADDPDLVRAPLALKAAHLAIKEAYEVEDDLTQTSRWELIDAAMIGKGKFVVNQLPALNEKVREGFEEYASGVHGLIYDSVNSNIELKQKYVATATSTSQNKTVFRLSTDHASAKAQYICKLSDSQDKVTLTQDGGTGTIAVMKAQMGLDGTGGTVTIEQDGTTARQRFYKSSTPSVHLPTISLSGEDAAAEFINNSGSTPKTNAKISGVSGKFSGVLASFGVDANTLSPGIQLDGPDSVAEFMNNSGLEPVVNAKVDGNTGTMSSIQSILGLDGSGEKGRIIQNGIDAISKWIKPSTADSNNPQTNVQADGDNGLLSSIKSVLGFDGSGEKGTIFQDGLSGITKLFDPSTVGSDDPQVTPLETVELSGADGTGKIGVDSNGRWRVKLNDTVTYTDQNNVERTAAGFVTAEDFDLPGVASFKTKLIVTDQAIIGKASIGRLESVEADIERLEADKISANSITGSYIAGKFVGTEALTVHSLTATSLVLAQYSISPGSLIKAVNLSPVGTTGQYKLSVTNAANGNAGEWTFKSAASVKLTPSWSSVNGLYKVTASNGEEESATFGIKVDAATHRLSLEKDGSTSQFWFISIDSLTCEYDSTTHKYTPKVTVKAGLTDLFTNYTGTASGTEAYEAGQGSASQRTVSEISDVTLTSADITNDLSKRVTVTYDDQTTSQSGLTINAKAVYDAGKAAGWKAAYDGSKRTGNAVTYPKSEYGKFATSTASIGGNTLSYKYTESSASYDSGGSNELGYTVYQDYVKSSFTILQQDTHAVAWVDA